MSKKDGLRALWDPNSLGIRRFLGPLLPTPRETDRGIRPARARDSADSPDANRRQPAAGRDIAGPMPEVDPHDDATWRWVLHHYRFDPGTAGAAPQGGGGVRQPT
jgi:hypothetical protein